MRHLKKWIYAAGLAANDVCVVYFSFWLAYQIRFFYGPFLSILPVWKGIPPWELYHQALRAVIPLWILVFGFSGRLYKNHFSNAADEFVAVAKSAVIATLLVITATFIYRQYEYSRAVIGISFLVSVVFLFISRELWKAIVGRLWHRFIPLENVVILGQGKSIEAVVKGMKKNPHKKLEICSPKDLAPVIQKLNEDSLEEVYVSGQILQNEQVQAILDRCEEQEVEIKILPDLLEMRLGEIMVDDSLGLPILHLKPLSLQGPRYLFKRIFDVSLSILIVSVLFFPFLLLSLAILLDSKGGIFFYQERIGFREKKFRCLKFRTMRRNAEALLAEMKLPSFRGGPAFKMKDDPRITRVGKWVRKFSLDEMPQIWNVLRGEMSLIGPRPQVLAEAQRNPDWARKRYRILPGITGLWQVSGRADLTYEDMMRLDIYYLENWSPGLDLRILLKTLPVVLGAKGAY